MKQGEVLPIIWTIDDTPTPELDTMQEIEVAVLVNQAKQLTFKLTESDPNLQVIVDGTIKNMCTTTVLPEQSALFPVGRITSEIKITQSNVVVFKSEILVDYCYKSNTL